MTTEYENPDEPEDTAAADTRPPFRVRLPGFVREEDIGLGDLIKRATSAVGIRPCGGCAERAAKLNQWVTFSNKGRR
jgi:hypothetical protein